MHSNSSDDRKLIKESLKDRKLFVNIYRKYIKKIYQYCYFKLNGDIHITEDIVSQTFLKLFEVIDRIKPDKNHNYSLLPYTYTIARNYIFQHWTKQKHNIFIDLDSMDYLSDPNQDTTDLDKQLDSEVILKEIKSLDMLTRDIIYLKIYDDMTFEMISEELNISLSKTKMRYYRGIKFIENKLNK